MRSRFVVLILALLLSSCAGTRSYVGPSGSQQFTVKCKVNKAACYERAARACPNGYAVLEEESHMGGCLADLMVGFTTWYTLRIECN